MIVLIQEQSIPLLTIKVMCTYIVLVCRPIDVIVCTCSHPIQSALCICVHSVQIRSSQNRKKLDYMFDIFIYVDDNRTVQSQSNLIYQFTMC